MERNTEENLTLFASSTSVKKIKQYICSDDRARAKRLHTIAKKNKQQAVDEEMNDPFHLWLAATTIRFCYFKESHTVLGNTYGMLVLQDFEAMTPNVLARTIETVEGSGIVVLLLPTMNSLKQLYTMAMDVHSRFRTDDNQVISARFNERFLLSLASCKNWYVNQAGFFCVCFILCG